MGLTIFVEMGWSSGVAAGRQPRHGRAWGALNGGARGGGVRDWTERRRTGSERAACNAPFFVGTPSAIYLGVRPRSADMPPELRHSVFVGMPAARCGNMAPGPVAQRIEQQPSKLTVAGSIPAGVANKIKYLAVILTRLLCCNMMRQITK
jgi:hypothetical protein